MTDKKDSGPGVYFPPPFLFAGGILLAWLLERRVQKLPVIPASVSPIVYRSVSYLLILAGLVIAFWGLITFARAHTAIIPHKPASSLVDTGPYSFTRNPMYTGMTLLYLGIAVLLNSGWAFLLLPVVLFLLHRFVISREERYLSETFGDTYDAYRARVKRWV
jgi:protein-S-isoprenylcysteine O-methyltransferase Ste14